MLRKLEKYILPLADYLVEFSILRKQIEVQFIQDCVEHYGTDWSEDNWAINGSFVLFEYLFGNNYRSGLTQEQYWDLVNIPLLNNRPNIVGERLRMEIIVHLQYIAFESLYFQELLSKIPEKLRVMPSPADMCELSSFIFNKNGSLGDMEDDIECIKELLFGEIDGSPLTGKEEDGLYDVLMSSINDYSQLSRTEHHVESEYKQCLRERENTKLIRNNFEKSTGIPIPHLVMDLISGFVSN